ncbi:MAG: PHP domain-containing protein [Clostridia bacterium]|nr:PHP domain-containing protein [Clostridia bacterium]
MKYMDIHSHTYYSGCGKDEPHVIIDKAIESGIKLFGICDHNYGIGQRKEEYSKLINSLKKEYEGKITLLCGIEISVIREKYDMTEEDYKLFDYCLIENPDSEGKISEHNLFGFLKSIKIKKGIAHTDLFAAAEKRNIAPEEFFKRLADTGTFWEMNVNYDSIHSYREHEYVKRFFESETQQKIIKDSGVYISIGFDGHRIEDYLGDRVIEYNKKLEATGVKTADLLF